MALAWIDASPTESAPVVSGRMDVGGDGVDLYDFYMQRCLTDLVEYKRPRVEHSFSVAGILDDGESISAASGAIAPHEVDE